MKRNGITAVGAQAAEAPHDLYKFGIYAGGIVGDITINGLENCYNTGRISAANSGVAEVQAGGIAGYADVKKAPRNLYYLSGSANSGFGRVDTGVTVTVTPLSAQQFQDTTNWGTNFAGFDFDGTWDNKKNDWLYTLKGATWTLKPGYPAPMLSAFVKSEKAKQRTVTVSVSPAGAGTAAYAPPAANNKVNDNTALTFTASAKDGYVFAYWSVGGLNASNDTTYNRVVKGSDLKITATFIPKEYELTIKSEPALNHQETKTKYDVGTKVQLTVPNNSSGYTFKEWKEIKGGVEKKLGAAASLTYIMPAANATVTAYYEDITAPLIYPVISAARTAADTAALTFSSNEVGSYYYELVADDADVPAINTSGAGTACTVNSETGKVITTVNLTGLAAPAQDLYLAVKDETGNVSNPLKFDIPAYTPPPAEGVCELNGVGYESLADAMTALYDPANNFDLDEPQTIKLLSDITLTEFFGVSGMELIFDLNGHDLVISYAYTDGDEYDFGTAIGAYTDGEGKPGKISYIGEGNFTVSSATGYGITARGAGTSVSVTKVLYGGILAEMGGSVTVDNNSSSEAAVMGGIRVSDGNVTVTGDVDTVTADSGSSESLTTVTINGDVVYSVTASGHSTVTVDGDISGGDGTYSVPIAIEASGGNCIVNVTENVKAYQKAVYAQSGSTVYVGGNLTVEANEQSESNYIYGIHALNAYITIDGEILVTSDITEGSVTGIYLENQSGDAGEITVSGDVTVSGHWATGASVSRGTIDINGNVNASGYGATGVVSTGSSTLTVGEDVIVSGENSTGANAAAGGSIEITGNMTVSGTGATGVVESEGGTAGTEITLTAAAHEGYRFVNWLLNGEATGDTPVLTLIMPASDTIVSAVFEAAPVDPQTGGQSGPEDEDNSAEDETI
ncbi:MAG: InlB B-repeat-containing protein [Syntrophomonadaceae bacterium]|nr:InlB B-repeat-containing protein [Syntrophomonadaceae bacterium]